MLRYGTLFGEVYATSYKLEGVAIWLPFWETEMKASKIRKALAHARKYMHDSF